MVGEESGDRRNPERAGPGPIGIHRLPEAPLLGSHAGQRQPEAPSTRPGPPIPQSRRYSYLHEIGPESRMMEIIPFSLGFCPFGQLLGQAGVVDPVAGGQRQRQRGRYLFEALLGSPDIHPAAGKKLFEGQTLFGDLRMEGEGQPADFDSARPFQPISTLRTEIAPRSAIVGENFKDRLRTSPSPLFLRFRLLYLHLGDPSAVNADHGELVVVVPDYLPAPRNALDLREDKSPEGLVVG